MGDFDPRKHTAQEAGYTSENTYVRGLQMSQESFENMAAGHSRDEVSSMRKQVDDAEAAGLRKYQVRHPRGYYNIENGLVIGSSMS